MVIARVRLNVEWESSGSGESGWVGMSGSDESGWVGMSGSGESGCVDVAVDGCP